MSAEARTRYESQLDLAHLPYFDLRGGRLVLSDPALGPSIDMHTHLAMAFFVAGRVDVARSHPRTCHYLPVERPVDLEVYANKNLSRGDRARVTLDFARSALDPSARGMRSTHTMNNLLAEMRELGIRLSLLLPIEWPLLSRNAETYLELTRGHGALASLGSVHPRDRDASRRLDRQKELGARGIKLHPFVQLTRPDDARALRLQRLCGDKGLFVLWHCGPAGIEPGFAQRRSQLRFYERPIAECPQTVFVLGHSGALQMEAALDLACRYPNVWLELSSQSLSNVRRILERGPADRLVFGSDWPFYHQALPLAKVLLATESDPAARRRVLHDNAARLLGLDRDDAVHRPAP